MIYKAVVAISRIVVRSVYCIDEDMDLAVRGHSSPQSLVPSNEIEETEQGIVFPDYYIAENEFAALASRQYLLRFRDNKDEYVYSDGGHDTQRYVIHSVEDGFAHLAPKQKVLEDPFSYLTPRLIEIIEMAQPNHLDRIGMKFIKEAVESI
jgi:hypothetical protein